MNLLQPLKRSIRTTKVWLFVLCIGVLNLGSCKKDPPVFEESNVLVKHHPLPFDSSFALNVYPNPVNDTLTIQFTLSDTRTVSWMLYDMLGVNIANGVLGNLTPGLYRFPIALTDKPSGIYFLMIEMGSIRKAIRVVKS